MAYDHDRVRYPMYFDDNYGSLEQMPLTPKSLSATQSLREGLSVWAAAPPGFIPYAAISETSSNC